MYHEEEVIDGRLKWRSSPDGEWQEFTYEQMTERLIAAEHRAEALADELRVAGERDD